MFDANRHAFLKQGLRLDRNLSILDIGANPINEPTYHALKTEKMCDVIGFEPQKDAFDELQSAKQSNEIYINAAVGDGTTQNLYIYQMSGFTSFYKIYEQAITAIRGLWKSTREQDVVPIATTPLDDIDEVNHVDLLKIDVQGAESQIIQSGKNKLSDLVAVIIELRYFRLYENEQMMGDVDSLLRSKGLILHKLTETKYSLLDSSRAIQLRPRRANSQIIDGDAVYIKDVTKLETFTNEQLALLALSGDGVFFSFDLVLLLLDELVRRGSYTDADIDTYVNMLPSELRKPQ